MLSNSKYPGGTGSSIDDIAYLTRADHRVPTLLALTERPRSRSELWELTGVSSSTIRRTLGEFEDRNWVRKNGYQFEATPLGAFVAAAMAELIERIETERKLRDVWDWLSVEAEDLRIDTFADAVVTVASATDPYCPVNRFVSLLETADRFRLLGSDLAVFEPCRDLFRRRIADGMVAEIIDPPYVSKYVLSTYPDYCSETLGSGNLAVWVHEKLPAYGLCLFDDRISITGYNLDSGAVQVLIDTDAPEVREWAEATYESYRREARPLESAVE
ncbi:helix-turn-helix transcriptional regulator [Halegenticoccus tardaugens]|uniref:helix-turn-helix transcriptional regulator n=1 Tax=Halegenticoccus tardaugens TaxID=2071624 RepID=UPI00100A9978|nr:MarR family transcriptional regulator [Halegenticoccus tardaugens]